MGRIVRDIVDGLDSFVYEWRVSGVFAVALWVLAFVAVGITVAPS